MSQAENAETLKPCPFCGRVPIGAVYVSSRFAVHCECGCQGPSMWTGGDLNGPNYETARSKAIAAWNRLSAPVEAVAWEIYWPGAGPNSRTGMTRSRLTMEDWKKQGAGIRPLGPAAALAFVQAENLRLREAIFDTMRDRFRATRHPASVDAVDAEATHVHAWIVGSGDGARWRTWGSGSPEWTQDRERATRFSRREDAEAVHREDEDAWLVVPYKDLPNDADEAYEIGLRDGYEDAIQDMDLATGGDGEFKGSTLPGETVDVPAMKQRVAATLASLQAEAARLRKEVERKDAELKKFEVYTVVYGEESAALLRGNTGQSSPFLNNAPTERPMTDQRDKAAEVSLPRAVAQAAVDIVLCGIDPDTGRSLTHKRTAEILEQASQIHPEAITDAINKMQHQIAVLSSYLPASPGKENEHG